ncbi:MAG: M1 family aminopeptidase [Ignavibacteria bacterium]|jgi:aminopeptidase N
MDKIILVYLLLLLTSITGYAQDQHSCGYLKNLALNSDASSNKINYPGDENYDVNYYKLSLNIDCTAQVVAGEVTIKAKSMVDNLTSIFVDLSKVMNVAKVKSNGQQLQFQHNGDSDQIDIVLDKTYNLNEEFTIIISYSGTPQKKDFQNPYFTYTTSDSTSPLFSTLSEPYSTSEWWPCKDTPADKADSADIWLTTDTLFVPVSNGKLEDIVDNGSTHTYKWKVSYPIAQYLISVAMTDYVLYEDIFEYESGKQMPVTHYVYNGTLTQDRISQLERTVDMLNVFSELFGLYPFINEKYGHAQWQWGGGMEHQTISSMGAFGETLVSHELAHQWFGDKITCKDWQNIWLNEGFATYCESLWLENAYGKDYYMQDVQSKMARAKNASGTIYVEDTSSVSEIFNSSRSYAKGSIVLHMLRGILGDERFFEAIRTYINDPELAYDVAETEDLQRVVEETSDEDLDYFFQQWIYGENYPRYNVSWNYTEENNLYHVKVNISQEANSNPVFFTMPVQLEFETLSGSVIDTVFNNQQEQEFDIYLEEEPTQLTFDPANWILKELTVITSVENFDEIKNQFFLEQNYPNPFNPSTNIQYNIPEKSNVKLILYDNLGNEIATLIDDVKYPGYYNIELNSTDFELSSGVYFYQLITDRLTDTKKMVLIK